MRWFKRSAAKKKSIDALARGGGAVRADPTLTVLATVPIAQPDEDAQLAALEERKKALEAKKRQMEKKMMKKKRSKVKPKHKKVWEVEAEEEEKVRKRAMAAALQSEAPKRRSKRHAKKSASWRKAGLDSVKEDAPLDAPSNGKAVQELDCALTPPTALHRTVTPIAATAPAAPGEAPTTPLSPVSNKTESTHKIDNRRKAKAPPGGGLLLPPLLAESDSLTTEDGSTATSVTDRTPLLEELKQLKELDPLFSGARALDEARETIMGFDDNVDVVVDDEQPQHKGSAWTSLFSCGAGQCHGEADEPAEDTNAANDAKEEAESDSDGSSDDEGEDGDEDDATAGEHTLATYDSELASVESGTLVTFETSGTRTTATSALSGSTCDTDDTDTMASMSMGDSTVDTRSEAGTEDTEASSQAEEEPTKSSWFGAFRLGRSGPTPTKEEEADAMEPASDEGGEDAAKSASTGGDASSKESKESSARSGRPSIVKRLRNTPSPRLASMIAKKLAEREAAKGDSPATVATEAPPTVDEDAPKTEEEASGSVRPSEAEAPEAPSEEASTPEESEHASQPESQPQETELERKPAPEDDRAAPPLAEKAPAQQEIELQISPLVALPESKAEEPGPTATEEAAPVNDTKKHKRTASSSSKLFDKFHRAKDSSASVAKSTAPKKEAKETQSVKPSSSSYRRGAKSVKSTPSMYTKRGMKHLRGSPGMFDKMLAKTKSTSPVPRPAEDDPAHEDATMDASRPKESVVVDERTSSVEVSVPPPTREGRDEEEEDELAPLPRVVHHGERDGGDGERDGAEELVREASVTDQMSVATDALMLQAQELLGLEIAGQ